MATAPDPDVLARRLDGAVAAAGAAVVDAVLVTPGPDLRYLVGSHAVPLERLTCLVVPAKGDPVLVVPRLERAAAEASGAGSLVRIVSHEETDNAFAMTAEIIRKAVGKDARTVALADTMTALHVLRLRDAMPT